jgi:RNA polymerase sigma factor (sigma-70 family)
MLRAERHGLRPPEQDALFREYLPHVAKLARRNAAKLPLSADELENVGRIALWKLALEWQPGVTWSFAATASKRSNDAMVDEYRKQYPEAERERVARRRREEKGEEEPEITAQPTTSPVLEALAGKKLKTFDPLKDDTFPHELRDMTTSLSTKVGRKLTAELILEAAAEHPEQEQKLIVACLLEEISPREFARRTGQAHATMERKLGRVKDKLRRICKQRDITW